MTKRVNINTVIISIAVVIGCIILGGSLYAIQIQKQQSIERQQEAELKQEKELKEKEIQAEAAAASKAAGAQAEAACYESGGSWSRFNYCY